MSILSVKLIHTIVFFYLSFCILYLLYSGLFKKNGRLTKVAMASILIEGIILIIFNWKCPLTVYAESIHKGRGSVSDIFLPGWFANNLFEICVPLSVLGFIIAGYNKIRN